MNVLVDPKVARTLGQQAPPETSLEPFKPQGTFIQGNVSVVSHRCVVIRGKRNTWTFWTDLLAVTFEDCRKKLDCQKATFGGQLSARNFEPKPHLAALGDFTTFIRMAIYGMCKWTRFIVMCWQ